MKTLRSALIITLGVALIASGWIAYKHYHRPGLEAYAAHAYVGPAVPEGAPTLTATWYGTTSVLLSDGEESVLVDPFFSRPEGWLKMLTNQKVAPDPEKIGRWLKDAKLNRLQAVLVSHSHHDHAMDSGVIAAATRASLVGSESTAYIGRGARVGEYLIRVPILGKPIPLGHYTITFFESRHAGATGGAPTGNITEPLITPARYLDYKQGGTYSILVEHALGKVLFHGSSGYAPDMLKGQKADVTFLGIALLGELEPYLKETVDAVGATRVIPTHWDDFTRSLDEPLVPNLIGVQLDKFFKDMAQLRPQVSVQTLKLGEPVLLFAGAAPAPKPVEPPKGKKARRK
ncbi:MAG: MBL fold metallo-hydrolase [Pseudomonadota bacterium]